MELLLLKICNWLDCIILFFGVCPVSYTHLDVYKRQRFQESVRYKRSADKEAALEKFKITFQKQRLWNEVLKIEKNVKTESEKIDFSKVKIEPLFEEMVDFDTFSKSDFRAVKVKECVCLLYTSRCV